MEHPLITALGALIVRAGFAIHAVGMARSKNSAGAVMRQLCDLCIAVLCFWAVGYAIAAAGGSFLGFDRHLLFGATSGGARLLELTAAVLIAAGIVPGVLAERARFWPVLACSVLLSALIVPISILWSHGWLAKMGFHDIGGAGWLHLPGALCAAVGAWFVGPRTGKFNRDGSSTAIPGHSLPLAGIGVVFLLLGFFLFVGLNSAAAAMNVLLAASAAGLASTLFSQLRYDKPDIHLTFAATIGGMVAISAGADIVAGIGAVAIGAAAGVLVPLVILLLDIKLRIDDPSGGIAVHGAGAVWGLLAAPLLAHKTAWNDRLGHLGTNALAIAAIALLALILSAGLWLILKSTIRIRHGEAKEFDGLDLAEHDIGAYPDFQQNTIKSYHLREL